MDCCFEPGRLIVLPSTGGTESLMPLLSTANLPENSILYSVEDVLKHYQQLLPTHSVTVYPSFPSLVRVPIGEELSTAERLRRTSGIALAVPNYYVRPSLAEPTYHEEYISESLNVCGLMTPSPACGTGISIAVLDTGANVSVFKGVIPTPLQFDTDSPRPLPTGGVIDLTPYDECGHGSVVTTLIRRGAPGATIIPVKVMGTVGTTMGVMAGLYVASKFEPQIFNLSLALTCDITPCPVCSRVSSPVTLEQLQLLFQLVDSIYSANNTPRPLLIAAAGNVEKDSPLKVPACFKDVLAVGACESARDPQRSSDFSIYSGIPTDRFVFAPGGTMDGKLSFASLEGNQRREWGPEYFGGTSFSAPLATAVAARYLCGGAGGSPCSTGFRNQVDGRTFIVKCLKEGCCQDFSGYDRSKHGLGLVRYQLGVMQRVRASQ
jgi:hypothetical protein